MFRKATALLFAALILHTVVGQFVNSGVQCCDADHVCCYVDAGSCSESVPHDCCFETLTDRGLYSLPSGVIRGLEANYLGELEPAESSFLWALSEEVPFAVISTPDPPPNSGREILSLHQRFIV